MIFFCLRDWLFQARAEARRSGMRFCNRFAPLEGEGDVQMEEEGEEEKVMVVQGQSEESGAAKEARWRNQKSFVKVAIKKLKL